MATKDNKRPHISTGDTPHKDKQTRAMHPKEQGHLRRTLFSDNQSNNEVKHCACLYIFVLLCTGNFENILFTRLHVSTVRSSCIFCLFLQAPASLACTLDGSKRRVRQPSWSKDEDSGLVRFVALHRDARNVRLYYLHWQYTDLFIFRFVSLYSAHAAHYVYFSFVYSRGKMWNSLPKKARLATRLKSCKKYLNYICNFNLQKYLITLGFFNCKFLKKI